MEFIRNALGEIVMNKQENHDANNVDADELRGSLRQVDQGWHHHFFDFFQFWCIVSPHGVVLLWQKFLVSHPLVGVLGGWQIFRGAVNKLISFFYGGFPSWT